MSIIYSYPEQSILNPGDMLIGTSVEKVGGKQKNVTKNFTIQQVADFINSGIGLIDPVASDFQIPVFNQGGLKITGSIMSQDAFPNGTGITIAGNLTVNGGATIGDQVSNVVFDSPTKLLGPILDSGSVQGGVNQILISNQLGKVNWIDYEAGLTYEGTWDAAANTTNGQSNSPALVQGVGVSGHFYIVDVEGTTSLGPGLNDWHVGDWAVFLDQGGQPASWQKIDNTSVLTGDGTAGVFAKWTDTTTLNDSLMSQSGTNILINGGLKVKDTVEATITNSNLKLKGNGTGGVEIMSADGITDGKITLNCSQNSHGVTIQSPAHGSGATYTLILPTSFGGAGDVLTSAGANPSQLIWTTPSDTTYDLGSSTDGSNVKLNLDASVGSDSFVTLIGSGVAIAQANDTVTFTVPPGDTYDLGTGASVINNSIELQLTSGSGTDNSIVTLTEGTGITLAQASDVITISGDTYDMNAGAKVNTSVPLNLTSGSGNDNSVVNLTEGTGITLTRNSATDITIAGSAQGVTSVTSANNNTLTVATTTTTPVITAVTAGGVGTGNFNLTTGDQVQSAIDTALAGTLTFKGTFNAATGSITSGINNGLQLYSGTAGVIAITQGDFYIADTAGSFYNTTAMNVGDEAIALFTVAAAPPGSAITDWSVVPTQSAGVTGSGTGEAISFFSGASGASSTNLTSNADIVIDSNGYLGLGTSNPSYSLDIDSIYATPTIQVQDSSSATYLRLSSDSGSLSSKIESSNDVQFFDGNGTMLMNMTTMAGYVGIGTQPSQFPFTKLHINDPYAQTLLTLESDGDTQRTNYHNTGPGVTYASSGTEYGNFTIGLEYDSQYNTTLFNFSRDGRLGIGPYFSPNYTLDVQEGTSTGNDAIVNILAQNSYSSLQLIASQSSSFGTPNYINSSSQLQIQHQGSTCMSIERGGNFYIPLIGINTASPSVSFEIATQDAIKIPVGSNSDKNSFTASNGMLRYNSDALEFEGYSNSAWGAIGGGGASATITSNQTTTSNATTTVFLLGATPNGNSVNFVDVFIDGVYQETTTYSVSGASFDEITLNSPVPSGVTVETKTTADYNVGAAVNTVSLGQSNTTGNVDLRIVPLEVTSGQTIPGNANFLYIFTATGAQSIATVNLPGSPTLGDSIKISNLGGLANVLGANGNKIMGVAADLTINTPTAAFEIIWSGSNNGWIIIGNV